MPSLLIGCGHSRTKNVYFPDNQNWVEPLITVDMNPDCGADVVMTMDGLGQRSWRHPFGKRLPFPDNHFDEVGAFNCMEHWGAQGDWRAYFDEMAEYHRVMKPGALFYILVPIGDDAYADPGHTRFFHVNHFGFLSQGFYEENGKLMTCYTDYKWYWKKNFDVLVLQKQQDHHLAVILRKPQ